MRHQRFVVLILGLSSGISTALLGSGVARADAWGPNGYSPPAVTRGAPAREFGLAEIDEVMAIPELGRDGIFAELTVGPSFTHAGARAAARESSLSGVGAQVNAKAGVWLGHNWIFAGKLAGASALSASLSGTAIPERADGVNLTTVSGGANLTYVADGNGGRYGVSFMFSQLRLIDRGTRRVLSGTGFGPGLALEFGRDFHFGNADDSEFESPAWSSGFGLGIGATLAVSRQSDFARSLSYTTVVTSVALTLRYD